MPPRKKIRTNHFFKDLFGFSEKDDYETTRAKLLEIAQFHPVPAGNYPREKCIFTVDGESIDAGLFSMPSVQELQLEVDRKIADLYSNNTGKKTIHITVQNMVGEARSLHQEFPHSIVQAASQFNTLEFPGPGVTPEEGISAYIYDRTQGPACAVACAAGTAYRNYLVPVPFDGSSSNRGQRSTLQLDGMADLEAFLKQEYPTQFTLSPWRVKNGYVDSSQERIRPLNRLLQQEKSLQSTLENLLRVGVQEDTTITDIATFDTVCTQVYSSALSVGYSRLSASAWKPMAQVVLNATYKATLLVGVLKALEMAQQGKKSQPILLTKVGAGVFGNEDSWVIEAILKAVQAVSHYEMDLDLDVRIVHFSSIDPSYRILESNCDDDDEEL